MRSNNKLTARLLTGLFCGLLLLLSGCSGLQPLKPEAKVLGGVLATAGMAELSGENMGLTHGLVSYGFSSSCEEFADDVFHLPEQELSADLLASGCALIPAVYYMKRESGDSFDSSADEVLPVGNFLYMLYKRFVRD